MSCFQWERSGDCKFGNSCRFTHEASTNPGRGGGRDNSCFQFKETGSCRYGGSCKFEHPGFGGQMGGLADVSMGECHQFRDQGTCSFGNQCRFNHGRQNGQTSVQREGASGWVTSVPSSNGWVSHPSRHGPPQHAQFSPYAAPPSNAYSPYGYAMNTQMNQMNPYADVSMAMPTQSLNPMSPSRVGPCYQWKQEGQCRFGQSCRFSHDGSGSSDYRMSSGRDSGQGACHSFRDTGTCSFGNGCRFSH